MIKNTNQIHGKNNSGTMLANGMGTEQLLSEMAEKGMFLVPGGMAMAIRQINPAEFSKRQCKVGKVRVVRSIAILEHLDETTNKLAFYGLSRFNTPSQANEFAKRAETKSPLSLPILLALKWMVVVTPDPEDTSKFNDVQFHGEPLSFEEGLYFNFMPVENIEQVRWSINAIYNDIFKN